MNCNKTFRGKDKLVDKNKCSGYNNKNKTEFAALS